MYRGQRDAQHNPQEGQSGESALASYEPRCYTWGTTFSVSCPSALGHNPSEPSLGIGVRRKGPLSFSERLRVSDRPMRAPFSISVMEQLVIHHELEDIPRYLVRVKRTVYREQIQLFEVESQPSSGGFARPCERGRFQSSREVRGVHICEYRSQIPVSSHRSC